MAVIECACELYIVLENVGKEKALILGKFSLAVSFVVLIFENFRFSGGDRDCDVAA